MEYETWRDVVGYEGLYAVSNLGNVKRVEHEDTKCRQGFRVFKERPLKSHLWNGYEIVCLSKDNKRKNKRVHRLVADAFIPNADKGKDEVNHIDGNKLNNNSNNLEWCTKKENIEHAIANGLYHRRKRLEEE